jgi:hypothetical protein
MTSVVKNTDLNSGLGSNNFDGWETCAASGRGVVVYTANFFGAYSVDGGDTFSPLDPYGICASNGETFCCDQVVIYSPQIDMFFWVMQTEKGNYLIALASPDEIRSRGKDAWVAGVLSSSSFGTGEEKMDYPEVSIGNNFLYMAFNRGPYSIGLRMPLSEIKTRDSISFVFFRAMENFWLRPVQSTRGTGYFVSENFTKERGWEIRVFAWPESSGTSTPIDFPIPTIPSEDWTVTNPDGGEWLPATRIDQRIHGATRSGNYIWVAWNAARKVVGADTDSFPYPHIEVAVINMMDRTVRIKYLWNSQFAFAFPALATDGRNDVGISFCWGGGKRWYPQHGVGMLTGPGSPLNYPNLVSTSRGVTRGAGGDYISIRTDFPSSIQFCASGFNVIKLSGSFINHPHFVVFST